MSTAVVFRPRTAQDQAAVERFNHRMVDGGSENQVSDTPYPFYGVNTDHVQVQTWVCAAADEVHGAVTLKTLRFHVSGADEVVAFYKYPVTEARVDKSYALLPVLQQKEVLKRFPLAYGLGVGSLEAPVAQLMIRTGWASLDTWFLFKVFRLNAFLKNIRILPRNPLIRRAMRVARVLGIGRLYDLAMRLSELCSASSQVAIERVDRWPVEIDTLWETTKGAYSLVGERSRAVLDVLFPPEQAVFKKVVVRMPDSQRLLGYIVYTAEHLRDHKHFGNMRLGAIVDVFAAPEDACLVLQAALTQLRSERVDLTVLNHIDERWGKAAQVAGMRRGPSNFFLFLSPGLRARFADLQSDARRFFFTRADGDGPIHLF
jgi:hypothetical protein